MSRTVWIALVSVAYALVLIAAHRIRLYRARRGGIPGSRFGRFDHRALLDELRELYEAGLPDDFPGAAPAPERPARRDLGAPVTWLRPDVWEAEAALPELVVRARERVRAGHDEQVGALVEPTQDARVDQHLTSLGIHFFLVRLYRGDLAGATRVLQYLPAWTNGRISPRVVEKHLGQLAYLLASEARAKGDRSVYGHAGRARRHLRRAAATSGYADPGTRALWAHLVLEHFTWFLNVDWMLWRTDRLLRRALGEHRSAPILYYELAHVCALRGRSEEAVDHLARSLYFAGKDPFYPKAVLEIPEVARFKPALVAQARSRLGEG